jgi:hypothetical protein
MLDKSSPSPLQIAAVQQGLLKAKHEGVIKDATSRVLHRLLNTAMQKTML